MLYFQFHALHFQFVRSNFDSMCSICSSHALFSLLRALFSVRVLYFQFRMVYLQFACSICSSNSIFCVLHLQLACSGFLFTCSSCNSHVLIFSHFVPSCISFHTYFIKFHIPLSLYSFCGSKTADTNELVFTSELTFPVQLDGLIKFSHQRV